MLFYAVLCCRHRTADSRLLLMMVNKGVTWTHFQQKPVSRKFGKYGVNYWTLAKMWQKSLISTAHLDECGLIHRKVTTYCNVSKWIQFGLCIQRSNMGFKYKCFQSELVIKMDRRERKIESKTFADERLYCWPLSLPRNSTNDIKIRLVRVWAYSVLDIIHLREEG